MFWKSCYTVFIFKYKVVSNLCRICISLLLGLFLFFFISLIPLYGMHFDNELLHETINGRICIKTISDYGDVLRIIKEEEEKDPFQTFFHLTDWDETIVAITNFDLILRQHNTASVIKELKNKKIPTAVVTARWYHSALTLEKYQQTAECMEEGTGVCVSDQECFRGKTIDLRDVSEAKRGIFINGICFTGSAKGPVTNLLIDHPDIPKATHYLFVEDDPKYVTQMIEIFKGRREKLTVLHYPSIVPQKKHAAVLEQFQENPLGRLPFLIRHKYTQDAMKALENPEILAEMKANNALPWLVDLAYGNNDELAEHMTRVINFNFETVDVKVVEKLFSFVMKMSDRKDKDDKRFLTWLSKKFLPNKD
jgi:hypothetical protein